MSQQLSYYFDEHVRRAIAEQLRLRAKDVLTTVEAGRAHQGLQDQDQLTYAASLGRVIVTEDSDFVVLSNRPIPHAGIVYFPVQLSIGASIEYLELLARTTSPKEMRNQLVYGAW